ncbi:nuclease EXOG, mitochondrial isoform X2 [Rhinatrema bivittatum]|uniref:nuclease EXOG, mitochondrial isoform X2 n=1 Tax=Rhinatrema bivittatum TaxID=194408 RepID=UPI001128BE4E|nr:nuclease EXOG, mitochondrial isoform X2 [Rhinatrema bivittatum]
MARAFFSSRFLGGFALGAAASTVSCFSALRLWQQQHSPAEPHVEEIVLEEYGFPLTGSEVRYYANHVLSYNQAMRVPRWVIEHISQHKTVGDTNRERCKFRPDPSVPPMFSATNEDYFKSGWSRGHMAPAGDNKFSERAMAETFYLSNIVPQNYENNAGFWNRIEMYCRELTKRFEDVWVVSGPLALPQTGEDGKRRVTYQVIGKHDVAVPSHLYKVILARRSKTSSEPLAIGAFVVPNSPISFGHQLPEFQVSVEDLEKMAGMVFFPRLDKTKDCKSICEVDTCKLMTFENFTLYLAGRKMESARNLRSVEKAMAEVKEAGIQPDEYLLNLYKKKKEELLAKEQKVHSIERGG